MFGNIILFLRIPAHLLRVLGIGNLSENGVAMLEGKCYVDKGQGTEPLKR